MIEKKSHNRILYYSSFRELAPCKFLLMYFYRTSVGVFPLNFLIVVNTELICKIIKLHTLHRHAINFGRFVTKDMYAFKYLVFIQ